MPSLTVEILEARELNAGHVRRGEVIVDVRTRVLAARGGAQLVAACVGAGLLDRIGHHHHGFPRGHFEVLRQLLVLAVEQVDELLLARARLLRDHVFREYDAFSGRTHGLDAVVHRDRQPSDHRRVHVQLAQVAKWCRRRGEQHDQVRIGCLQLGDLRRHVGRSEVEFLGSNEGHAVLRREILHRVHDGLADAGVVQHRPPVSLLRHRRRRKADLPH